MKRLVRKAALVLFPATSFTLDYVRQIKDEGFTDLAVGTIEPTKQFPGQGYMFDQAKQLAQWAAECGLGLIAFTAYMKYREIVVSAHPERGLKCAGGTGVTLDSDGLSAHDWLCPFQPDNKAEYLTLLKDILEFPTLREIHLNDEAAIGFGNGSIGCYCDYCIAQYTQRFGHAPPKEPDWQSDAWWQWMHYRMEQWTLVHAEFRDEIKKHRPEVAVGIQHSPLVAGFHENPWLSGIDLARDASALDVLCTDPYHHIHYPLFSYRPMRRILTEATRTLAGATIKRSLNIYPQAFTPPGQSVELTHRDGLMAGIIPFALGAETITPYCYELMKLIPGFCEGLLEADALIPYFQKTRPYHVAAVVNPTQTEVYGHPQENWGQQHLAPWPDIMNRVGLSWRWMFDGRLTDAADELTTPIIMPETHCLTQPQRELLVDKNVLWVGCTPIADWPGHGPCPQPPGNCITTAELTPVGNSHSLLDGVTSPILLASTFPQSGIEGKTIAQINGRPGLVIHESGPIRQAWLAGRPVYDYVIPGHHGAARTPTGGIALLKNILLWLAKDAPRTYLSPYPPDNDYRELRPTDRREVPTMELFPMLGDDCLVCLIFNYLGLAYRTNLIMHMPQGTTPVSLTDIYSGQDLLGDMNVDNDRIVLPIDTPADKEFLAIELRWSDDKSLSLLDHLREGCGVRQTSRLVGVHRDTVTRLARLAGDHAKTLHDERVAFSPAHR